MEWHNWCGLASARPTAVAAPRDVDEVVAAVRSARADGTTVKMVGTGHSFTAIAAPEHALLLPQRLSGLVSVDRDALTATAWAGTPLRVLNRELERVGLSLPNMGDIAEQTLAGAVSTGTHGSGGTTAGLAAQLAALELVTGTGEVLSASPAENPDLFDAARIGLGALGILTTLTFRVEPMFALQAHERPTSWDEGVATLLELADRHDHVDGYWFPHTDRMLLKLNDRLPDLEDVRPLPRLRGWVEDELLANTVFAGINRLGGLAPRAIPALNRVSAATLTERSYSDLAHRVFTSPRRVRFKELEFTLPREAGLAALAEARRAIEAGGWRIGFPVEIRTAPAEDAWLSPAYGRDSMHLSFHTWVGADHVPYFLAVERILRDHGGRPHWGKLHTRTVDDLAPVYPRFGDFLAVRDRLDPDRVFDNAYLRRVLGTHRYG